jgi:hypothetical protein
MVYVAVNQCLRGMVTGCDNLLDDAIKPTLNTDLPEDLRRARHNHVAAPVYHHVTPAAWQRLQAEARQPAKAGGEPLPCLLDHGDILRQAADTARGFLHSGLGDLLDPRHAMLVVPMARAIAARIGAAGSAE